MLTCLNCHEQISLREASDVSDSLMAEVTCPHCGQKHNCDMVGESTVLTLPMSLRMKVVYWLMIAACVGIAFLIRKAM